MPRQPCPSRSLPGVATCRLSWSPLYPACKMSMPLLSAFYFTSLMRNGLEGAAVTVWGLRWHMLDAHYRMGLFRVDPAVVSRSATSNLALP